MSHDITPLEYITLFLKTNNELVQKVGKFKLTSLGMQEKEGNVDCGLFAIAGATDLAYGNDPANVILNKRK